MKLVLAIDAIPSISLKKWQHQIQLAAKLSPTIPGLKLAMA